MKFKQGKKTRKCMAMYKHVFGFHTPYRVLCDGNFLQAALEMKLFVKDLLPKTLLGPCVPVVSKCIRGELQQLGDAVSGATLVAKRFECIRCTCDHGKKDGQCSARACILKLVSGLPSARDEQQGKHRSGKNEQHLVVATQDVKLINALRQIPGVPVMQVTGNKGSGRFTLHPPSPATIEAASRRERAKCGLGDEEKKTLERKISKLAPPAADGAAHSEEMQNDAGKPEEKSAPAPSQEPLRRKKVKGPNPLSVKKSIKKAASKPARKRQHRKRTKGGEGGE